ncbi:MAG: Bax inhibitor-1/YccA family membrane protein, partial [Bacilli bacterium]
MIRNSNPIFTSENYQRGEVSSRGMTVGGTVGKTLILFVMLLATAAYAYNQTLQGELSTTVFYGALISTFIVGFIAMSAPKLSPVLAPVYAAIEGVLIGMISAMYAGLYEGIVLQAVLATLGVFLACLTLYATGL